MMTEKQRTAVALGLMALGAACLVIGVLRGEHTVVWRKAINICLECIGLG